MLASYITTVGLALQCMLYSAFNRPMVNADIQSLITDTLLPLAEKVCQPMSEYGRRVAELRKLDREAQEERKAKQGGTKEEERERRWERLIIH